MRRRGFTLIELMISITLVAALAVGMLMAMRVGLITLEKVDGRLQSNRRVISVQQLVSRELANALAIQGSCGAENVLVPAFNGNSQTLHFVSSYSMTEGARGYPRVIEMQVIPADQGVRLIANEALYTGPMSVSPFCQGGQFLPGRALPSSLVLADRLAYCRFVYKTSERDSIRGGGWREDWTKPELPYAVRVEMAPLIADPARLSLMSITARIRTNRDLLLTYGDY